MDVPIPSVPGARSGQRVLGRYRLGGIVGSGGVATVYAAYDDDGLPVAVKILHESMRAHPGACARFLREARVSRRLVHPAVPRLFDEGLTEDGVPVMVMELLRGRDFDQIVETTGPLTVEAALAVGSRIAHALDAAHALGIVHRDVKPGNVMQLDGQPVPGGVRVLDFGIAFCLDEPRLTETAQVHGTAAYMSPEQACGEQVGPAADLYALGGTLYTLLSGALPFEGSALQQMAAHAHTPARPVRERREEVPDVVSQYVSLLMAKEPDRRPAAAALVAHDLRALSRWAREGGAPPFLSALVATPDAPEETGLQRIPADASEEARIQTLRQELARVSREAFTQQCRILEEILAVHAQKLGRRVRDSDPRLNQLEERFGEIQVTVRARTEELVARVFKVLGIDPGAA